MSRGKHPNSQANLQPFEKGVSGNPSGRAKAFSKLKAQLKALGKEDYFRSQFDVNPQGTRRELVHTAIWDKAQDGDKWAILLLERLGCLD
jgi:hypothetical protein